MKNRLTYFLLIITSVCFGQKNIGVNVEIPLSNLHVNGDASLSSSLNVEASVTAKGNPGKPGELLVSQGPNKSPQWKGMEDNLNPLSYKKIQTSEIFLPAGFNKPWLSVPGLEQEVIIPKGKKAMITILAQTCVMQTKDVIDLVGISSGIFRDDTILISNTTQLVHMGPGYSKEFTIIPINYTEYIDASLEEKKIRYSIKSRTNYSKFTDDKDIKIMNNPFDRGDLSVLNIAILMF